MDTRSKGVTPEDAATQQVVKIPSKERINRCVVKLGNERYNNHDSICANKQQGKVAEAEMEVNIKELKRRTGRQQGATATRCSNDGRSGGGNM